MLRIEIHKEKIMKKKIFFTFLIVMILACTFAVTVSAKTITTVEGKEVTVTTYDGAPSKTKLTVSTDDVVVFDDGFACPSAYIFKDTDTISEGDHTGNNGLKNNVDFSYIKEKTGKTYELSNIVELDIPKGITKLGKYGFTRLQIKRISIPETATSIGGCCFEKCTALKQCVFEHPKESELTSLPAWIFQGCTSLTAFCFPECIEKINSEYEFSGCTSLTAVYLPKNLTAYNTSSNNEKSVFYGCTNMYFVNEPFTYDNIPEKPAVYYMPSGLTSVSGELFKNCNNINETIVFPVGVTQLTNSYAFELKSGSPSIKNIVFLGDMTSLNTSNWKIAADGKIIFANKNDKSAADIPTLSGSHNKIYCNADGNTVHFVDERGSTLKAPATCVSVAIYDAKCFCGKVLGEINGTELDPNNHNFDLEKGATIDDIKYTAYDKEGVITVLCGYGCEGMDEIAAEPIFTAEGYSIREDGKALLGGYKINSEALKAYNEFNGEKLTYGIVMSNAANVVITDGEYTGGKGIMATENNESYTTVKYVISGFSAIEQLADLNLVITLYVVDENGMSFIQNDTAYDSANANVDGTNIAINAITFGYIAQKTIDEDKTIEEDYKAMLEAITKISMTTVPAQNKQ